MSRIIFHLFLLSIFTFTLARSEEIPVGKIVIQGNFRTKEYIIRRELTTRVGEPFSEDHLQQDRNRLLNLGIFSLVEVKKVQENEGMTVYFIVEERISIIPFPLLLYSETEGWSYGGGIIEKNFRGRNQDLGIFATAGGVTDIYLSFYDPWWTGERISMRSEIARFETDDPYLDFHHTEYYAWGEMGKCWRYKLWGRIKLGFRYIEADKAGMTLSAEKIDRVPFALFTGIFDNRDLWVNPSKGWQVTAKVGQYGIFGEHPDFRFLGLSAAKFFPLKLGRTIGISNTFMGKFGPLSRYEQYYIGGANTIRGLAQDSYRGSKMIINSLEYRYDILKPRQIFPRMDFGLGMTVFTDGGMVFNNKNDISNSRYTTCIGGGLRLFLPIVQVFRVDVGWRWQGRYQIALASGSKF